MSIRNNKETLIILFVLLVSVIMSGCGKKVEEQGNASNIVESINADVKEVNDNENASEDVLETLPVEKEEKKVDLVEKIDISEYMVIGELLENVDYTTPRIIIWEDDAAYALLDGASYEGSGYIYLYVPKGKENIQYIDCTYYMDESEDVWIIYKTYLNLNEKNKVICRITYTDGTKDQIIAYITPRED